MTDAPSKPARRRSGERRAPRERSLGERALACLARREYSRAELARRLAPHAETTEALERLLDDLERRKLLSDARYAEARTVSLGRRYGTRRIQHELRSKGLSESLVDEAVANARVDELARARAVWTKKFGAPAADAAGRAKQARFLAGRGFTFDIIRRVIGSVPDDGEDA
jgi:regulatory protein